MTFLLAHSLSIYEKSVFFYELLPLSLQVTPGGDPRNVPPLRPAARGGAPAQTPR